MAALGVAFALPATATAAPRVDLQMRAVSTASSKAVPGSRLTAVATVENPGDKTAPRSRLGFYLSRDRRKGRGDFRLRPRVLLRARKPRTRTKLFRTLTVPAGVPLGSYVLIGCADDTHRIRERRERNNCRSAKRRVQLVAPASMFTTPSLLVNGLPDGSLTSDPTPTYSGMTQSPSAAIARVEAKLDSAGFETSGVSCTGCGAAAASWIYSPVAPLQDGPHSFGFRAIDASGRSSRTITRTLIVDATAPTFVSITAAPASNAVSATFSEPLDCNTVNPFDFSAQINGSAANVSQVTCSATITLTLDATPSAGAIVAVTLSGVVSDPAGNVVPAHTTRSDAA